MNSYKMKAYDRYHSTYSNSYNNSTYSNNYNKKMCNNHSSTYKEKSAPEKSAHCKKSKVIQFKVSNEFYDSLKSKADEENLSVNRYVKKCMTESVHGHTVLTPEMLLRLTGIYNMLELPMCNWNDDMRKNYNEEMRRLYSELFR